MHITEDSIHETLFGNVTADKGSAVRRTGCCFAAEKVYLAEEASVVEQVQLFSGGEPVATLGTREKL